MRGDLLELLDKEYATAFSTTMGFHDKSFLFILCHVSLASFCFFTELESHRDKIEIMFKMPLHSFENSCEPCLISCYTSAR